MKKYILNVFFDEKNNAGSKAKQDVATILKKQLGFKSIDIHQFTSRRDKLFTAFAKYRKIVSMLKKNDVILVQYPTYFGHLFESWLFKRLRKKGVKIITLVHDIDVLREENLPKYKNLSWVTSLLNESNVVISPNSAMSGLLQRNGLINKPIDLGIYDYLQSEDTPNRPNEKKLKVNFAGNLTKSKFISDINLPDDFQMILFGAKSEDVKLGKNTVYEGILPPDKLAKKMEPSFGLVWDGTSSTSLSGRMGQYLEFNNPHKASLYLSSNLVPIVPRNAAIASFIQINKVGITIDKLSDIPSAVNEITASEFKLMLDNIQRQCVKLRSGYYTTKAVQQALNVV